MSEGREECMMRRVEGKLNGQEHKNFMNEWLGAIVY
jgi:hypothetical protein